MAYDAQAIEVMVASPSDVAEERQIVRDVIVDWNAVNSKREAVCLMPVGWETHASPELSGRPQQIINERILESADLLVGIFWTRVGSPTGTSISGSIEEIERHLAAGKPVMLYFSTIPIVPSNLDREQFDALEKFKAWAMTQGLIETFDSTADFANKFRNQLQIALNSNPHLSRLSHGTKEDLVSIFNDRIRPADASLSPDAQELLLAAASDDNGMIAIRRFHGGAVISAGGRNFAKGADRRETARWVAAAEDLYALGLSRDINGKREIFELNHSGYSAADALKQ